MSGNKSSDNRTVPASVAREFVTTYLKVFDQTREIDLTPCFPDDSELSNLMNTDIVMMQFDPIVDFLEAWRQVDEKIYHYV